MWEVIVVTEQMIKKKDLTRFEAYDIVLGHIHSYPGAGVACSLVFLYVWRA